MLFSPLLPPEPWFPGTCCAQIVNLSDQFLNKVPDSAPESAGQACPGDPVLPWNCQGGTALWYSKPTGQAQKRRV